MKNELWIFDGVLFTQNDKRETVRGHLHLVEGRIAEITSVRPKKVSRHAEVLEARGLTIVPGFVQTHVHLCQTLFRNLADDLDLMDWLTQKIWKYEAAHTPDTLYTSAIQGIYELLSSGTTCILDMGTVRHTDSIFRAVKDSGIRANVGKCLMDHPELTPPNLRESTREALTEATGLYKKWNGQEGDRIRASFAPRFALSCTSELLSEVSRLSKQHRAIIHTHASESVKEIELVRKLFKCENIEYLLDLELTSNRLVLAHCVWLQDQEIEILRSSKTHVAHCPSSNLKLASGVAPIPHLLEKKINVSLGADGAPCNNNLNIFQEMRWAALIHKLKGGPKAMPALQVIDLATRNGAKALGWWDQIGSIEVGKKADLVALDLNAPDNAVAEKNAVHSESVASSIVYSTQPHHVRWTMVDGKVVYKNRKVTSISRNRLMRKIHSAHSVIL